MSASDQPTAGGDVCGKWMPKAKVYCARKPLHPVKCLTPEAYGYHADNRPRKTSRRRGVRAGDDLAVRSRWRRASKFTRFGITEKQFDQLLEHQDYACGICREPFDVGQRVCIDHDHACCPVPPDGRSRSCGRCVRGLLCVRCNTWLGWMETYGASVNTYLANQPGPQQGVPRPSTDSSRTG